MPKTDYLATRVAYGTVAADWRCRRCRRRLVDDHYRTGAAGLPRGQLRDLVNQYGQARSAPAHRPSGPEAQALAVLQANGWPLTTGHAPPTLGAEHARVRRTVVGPGPREPPTGPDGATRGRA